MAKKAVEATLPSVDMTPAAANVPQWTYEYLDKPRPCYRIQDGSDDGDVAEAWDEHVAKTLVGVMNPWEDVKDEWTPAIRAAHPTRSDSHEEYATAMHMVGHRHSKGELVALVNWLLVERARLVAERDRLRERVQATADVGCVNSPTGRRYPMKCFPKDPCSFCRARTLLETVST